MKNILTLIVGFLCLGIWMPVQTQAQTAVNMDLSMLTNRTALISYAFKQVQGVAVNVTCGSDTADNGYNERFYEYNDKIKTLEGIMELLVNERWVLQVTSPKDYFSISMDLYSTNNWNQIRWSGNKPQPLFSGGSTSQPYQDKYGRWLLPDWAEMVGLYLSSEVKIAVPNGVQLRGVRLIVRDSNNNNPYPVSLRTDSDGFYFQSQYAGNGVIAISGWKPAGDNVWSYFQETISLKDGSPVTLTPVEVRVLLQNSSDLVSFKNTSDLTMVVWTWKDGEGNEYGNIPLGIVTFDKPTTNVVLHTYTSGGQAATSYVLENQATGKKIEVPALLDPQTKTTVTNTLEGVYHIISQGIKLVSPGGYGGKG